MILGAYHYSIGNKPGSNHGNADGLSRFPLPEAPGYVSMPANVLLLMNQIDSTTIKASQIKSLTEQDPTLSKVKKYCMTAWLRGSRDEQLQPFMKRRRRSPFKMDSYFGDPE